MTKTTEKPHKGTPLELLYAAMFKGYQIKRLSLINNINSRLSGISKLK